MNETFKAYEPFGAALVPIVPGMKRTSMRGWTTKGKQMTASQIPKGYNAAIVIPPGHCILDFDIKNGGKGRLANETLSNVAGYSLLENDVTVWTPSGGWHCYYRIPDNLVPRIKMGGLDIKCGISTERQKREPNKFGTQAITCAGSVVKDGEKYTFAEGVKGLGRYDIKEMDGALVAYLFEKDKPRVAKPVECSQDPEAISKPTMGLDEVKWRLDLLDADDYETWYKVALMLAREYGDSGKGLFLQWSSKSTKYNEASAIEKYDIALQDCANAPVDNPVTLKTLHFMTSKAAPPAAAKEPPEAIKKKPEAPKGIALSRSLVKAIKKFGNRVEDGKSLVDLLTTPIFAPPVSADIGLSKNRYYSALFPDGSSGTGLNNLANRLGYRSAMSYALAIDENQRQKREGGRKLIIRTPPFIEWANDIGGLVRGSVNGYCCDPSNPNTVVKKNGRLLFNIYDRSIVYDEAVARVLTDDERSQVEGWLTFLKNHFIAFAGSQDDGLAGFWWFINALQPSSRLPYALVMVSPTQGIGKSVLGKIAQSIITDRYWSKVSVVDLKSQFNDYGKGKLMIVGEEFHQLGNSPKALNSILKECINADVINSNSKYSNRELVYLNYSFMIFSNELHSVYVNSTERRLLVLANDCKSIVDFVKPSGMDWQKYYSHLHLPHKNHRFANILRAYIYQTDFKIPKKYCSEYPFVTRDMYQARRATMTGMDQDALFLESCIADSECQPATEAFIVPKLLARRFCDEQERDYEREFGTVCRMMNRALDKVMGYKFVVKTIHGKRVRIYTKGDGNSRVALSTTEGVEFFDMITHMLRFDK